MTPPQQPNSSPASPQISTITVPIVFIRHGETDYNGVLKKIQGHLDVPLNDEGRDQARKAGRALASETCSVTHFYPTIFSSDLSRAKETAEIICQELNSSASRGWQYRLESDSRLRELCYGALQGKSWFEFRSKLDQVKDPDHPIAEGAETHRQLLNRVLDFVRDLLRRTAVAARQHSAQVDGSERSELALSNDDLVVPMPSAGSLAFPPVIVATHGGVVRSIASWTLGLELKNQQRFKTSNAHMTRIEICFDVDQLDEDLETLCAIRSLINLNAPSL